MSTVTGCTGRVTTDHEVHADGKRDKRHSSTAEESKNAHETVPRINCTHVRGGAYSRELRSEQRPNGARRDADQPSQSSPPSLVHERKNDDAAQRLISEKSGRALSVKGSGSGRRRTSIFGRLLYQRLQDTGRRRRRRVIGT
ncbi:hypothetical protein HPB50_015976 [Hyalomma asiaticum]|uniref:Uncharacterized protein n=1 Tax=Hyalomma asiaticum TaxID=266040 RepID=A0ACB7RPD7_HYAAI|nr:hypothetical protein HPB50_015976 [Hyalomma asiaticum]